MKEVAFSHAHCLLSDRELEANLKKIELFRAEIVNSTNTSYSFLDLPFDTDYVKTIEKTAKILRQDNPAYFVLVGIGGSNLGAMAVQQLVQGKMHNEAYHGLRIAYADTVDTDEISDVQTIITQTLRQKKKVVLNCVTKSGKTTETIANFLVLLETLKKHDTNYREHVVITTDQGSTLERHAKELGYHTLVIPKDVGGRFSVFSAAGLFPLALAGINIRELLTGAAFSQKKALSRTSTSALSAAIREVHMRKGQTIQDLFMFGNDFKALGKWYRQLFAESLGKGCDVAGKVCLGITPTYSIGTTDMHSIAQLYLGGPYDKFTTFIKVKETNHSLSVPKKSEFSSILPYLSGKDFKQLMEAIYKGVLHSFKEGKRPFTELILPDKSSYSLGQLMQTQMLEVVYLAHLLGVNAFDQPDIESYKEETRRLLK